MKKYVVVVSTILAVAFTFGGCAKEDSTVAYKHVEEATVMPNVTGESGQERKSEMTEKPSETKKPVVTAKPSETKEPVVTAKPRVAKKPVVTEKPSETKKPVVTAKPSETKKPVVTVEPSETKKPVISTPRPTRRPVVSTPRPTRKPVVSTPSPTKKPVQDTESGTTNSSYSKQVLALVNEERAKEGLPALTTNATLQKAADKRAMEIVENFSHTRPDGSSGVSVLEEFSISYRAWGENIAYGQRTPNAVMTAWMNSSGHRANILSEKFGKVGIGCYQKNGVLYWTQVFMN